MDKTEQENLLLLEHLSERIVKALDVLERKDFYAARLILADLWQELEVMLAQSETMPGGTQTTPLSPEQRVLLKKRAAILASALRARPQSESQEMASQLEDILRD